MWEKVRSVVSQWAQRRGVRARWAALCAILSFAVLAEMLRRRRADAQGRRRMVLQLPSDAPYAPARASYVVVGGGTAGLALASRLAQADVAATVVVLEAGEDAAAHGRFHVRVPLAASELQRTDVDWQYVTEPQPHTAGRVHRWPRGRLLGGSSSINWMLYVRGSWADFDGWVRRGAAGWAWQDVFPYFVRGERRSPPDPHGWHGDRGPVDVTDAQGNLVAKRFVRACAEAGIGELKDYNAADAQQLGAAMAQLMVSPDGERCSSARAYLGLAAAHGNVRILAGATATRVVIRDGRAVGVEYAHKRGDRPALVLADREVLLCAGAIGSPQLLLLSGVGPEQQLRAHAVPVAVPRAGVGKHLQDHLMVPVLFHASGPFTLDEKLSRTVVNIARYVLFRSGPLRSQALEAVAFLRSRLCDLPPPLPDLQIHCVSGTMTERIAENMNLPWRPEIVPKYGFTLLPTLLHPVSAGELRLRSADPFDKPLIDPRYLENPADLRVLVEGVRLAHSLVERPALKPLTKGPVVDPAIAHDHAPGSDAYLEEWVRRWVVNVYHYAGTCRMGARDDPLAVVDPQLRVIGVDALRVVDASIMPEITSGNTCAPVLMIAERAADLVADYWRERARRVNAFSPRSSL